MHKIGQDCSEGSVSHKKIEKAGATPKVRAPLSLRDCCSSGATLLLFVGLRCAGKH